MRRTPPRRLLNQRWRQVVSWLIARIRQRANHPTTCSGLQSSRRTDSTAAQSSALNCEFLRKRLSVRGVLVGKRDDAGPAIDPPAVAAQLPADGAQVQAHRARDGGLAETLISEQRQAYPFPNVIWWYCFMASSLLAED